MPLPQGPSLLPGTPSNFAHLLPLRSRGRIRPFCEDAIARRLHQRWIPRAHHNATNTKRSHDLSEGDNLDCSEEDGDRRKRTEEEARVWTAGGSTHDEAVSGGIFNLEFNQTGSVLAAACEHRSILLFDPGSRKKFRSIENAHEDCVNCVRFLDDRFFATCSDDCTVALWDLRNLRGKVRTFKGHSNWVKNIEYAAADHALVTSGFGGAVYHWDINRYSEEEESAGQKLFHTSGLMRMRMAPATEPGGAPRMVMSTMHGYLMVVHDLDLEHLQEDLKYFKPNMYRLLQLSGQPLGNNYMYTPFFHSKRNRMEFIDDFPLGNTAELISSLKIHPQGWVAVTRNISADENTEWCCIHDIHGAAADPQEDELINDQQQSSANGLGSSPSSAADSGRRFSPFARGGPSTEEGENSEDIRRDPLEGTGLDRLADFLSASFGTPHQQQQGHRRQISIQVNEDPSSGRRTVQIRASNDPEESETSDDADDNDAENEEIQMRAAIIRAEMAERRRRERQRLARERRQNAIRIERQRASAANSSGVSVAPGPTMAGDAVAAAGDAADEEQDVQRVSNFLYHPRRRVHVPSRNVPASARIHRNQPRLTHYLEESNTGRGFIKEVSFSPDGRILCSPFGFGFRLLSFNDQCEDLSACAEPSGAPARVLHELGTVANCHSSCVLSTAFAPHQFMLVAGSLHGNISWHQPLP